jgi:hypothetical protein
VRLARKLDENRLLHTKAPGCAAVLSFTKVKFWTVQTHFEDMQLADCDEKIKLLERSNIPTKANLNFIGQNLP